MPLCRLRCYDNEESIIQCDRLGESSPEKDYRK